MTRLSIVLAVGICAAAAASARAESPEAVMNAFFARWADNGRVTAQSVSSLYADRVDYYGHRTDRDGVLRDKLAFVRRWPSRSYAVVPGSVHRSCDEAQSRCTVDVVLAWQAASQGRGAASQGRATVSLVLVRQDGQLKIAREGGRTISRSH